MRSAAFATLLLLAAVPASAQNSADTFNDGPNGAKVHVGSGFVCPPKLAGFERDAVGEKDPSVNSDFCAYAARDGVYGTVTLTPLSGPYDPKSALGPQFSEQEGIGGKLQAEATVPLGDPAKPLSAYTRTYETTTLEELHYRTLFAAAAVGNWAVEATVEYASPRDDQPEQDFLAAVFSGAMSQIAHSATSMAPPVPVAAASPNSASLPAPATASGPPTPLAAPPPPR